MLMLTDEEKDIVFAGMNDRTRNFSERIQELLAEYERITGFREANPNAIFHHIAST